MADQRLRDLGAHLEGSIPMHDFDDLLRRGRRHVARRRAGTVAAVVAVTLATVFGVAVLVDQGGRTSLPVDRNKEQHDRDIFADIHGWIVYGETHRSNAAGNFVPENGIWAVNPARPGDPRAETQLTEQDGKPLGWSSDGTKLLIRRFVSGATGPEDFAHAVDLVVLNADRTEIRVVPRAGLFADGSISPDGSRVVFSNGLDGDGIYTVGTGGGTPRLLRAAVPRRFPGEELAVAPVGLYRPAFSPDGAQIAYFDGMGDWGHSLRVMRSDGTGVRVLIDRMDNPGHIDCLVWSPDGQRLAFAGEGGNQEGIWVIGVDGSGLSKIAPHGVNPGWSPDGTRISYQRQGADESGQVVVGTLRIADVDGAPVTDFGFGGSGPWNPLPLDQ
jgi:Tol biopolymer transport system component